MTQETLTSQPEQVTSDAAPPGLKFLVKRLLFPGMDLHTRCRYRFLPRNFLRGNLDTLDAGCGNGALSYAAYQRGNRVLGITKDAGQIAKARAFFSARGTDTGRLQFEVFDLYDLPQLDRKFDQIICSETLEHIQRDDLIVRYFHTLLREGGVLHLCCPFSNHPFHSGHFDTSEERGWHMRDGYTLQSYQNLLEPAGFRIVKQVGIGSPVIVALAKPISRILHGARPWLAVPLFLLTWPIRQLDYENPKTPFSLYVQAVKI